MSQVSRYCSIGMLHSEGVYGFIIFYGEDVRGSVFDISEDTPFCDSNDIASLQTTLLTLSILNQTMVSESDIIYLFRNIVAQRANPICSSVYLLDQ